MIKYLLSLVLLLLTQPVFAEKNPETMILGDWCGKSGHAFHEQFVLENRNNQKEFRSYLHQRPAETGTWELKGKNLVIKSNSNQKYTYKVLMLSLKKLVLLNQENDKEYYFRCKG